MSIGQVLLTGIAPNSPPNAHFGKDYYINAEGKTCSNSAGFHSHHTFDVKDVSSLVELRDGLRSIAYDRHRCLILFAEPNELARKTPQGQGLRRKAVANDPTMPPTLDLVPSSIFMVDIDDYPIPEGEDYDTVAETAPSYLLAPCLRDVSFVLQMSASAKLKAVDQLKAHYFFRIVDSEGNPKAVTKDWLQALFEATAPKRPNWEEIKKKTARWWHDPATFSAAQLLFTCAPTCGAGLQDPYTREDRVRLIEKGQPALIVTPELEAVVEAYLEPSRAPKKILLQGEAKELSQSLKRSRKPRRVDSVLSVNLGEIYPDLEEISSAFSRLLESMKRDCLQVDEQRYPIIAEYAKRAPKHIHQREVGYAQARRLFIEQAYQVRPKSWREIERLVEWTFERYLTQRLTDLETEEDARLQKLDLKLNTHEEIATAVSENVSRAYGLALAHPETVHCIKLPTASGKTHATLKVALEDSFNRPVIFALATRELADAKMKEAETIRQELVAKHGPFGLGMVRRWQSVSEQCARLSSDRYGPRELNNWAYRLLERSLNRQEGSYCALTDCPELDRCQAEDLIARGKEGLGNDLYITTHDKVNALGEDRLTEDTLIIYDELPKMWFESSVNLTQLIKVMDLGEDYSELAEVAQKVNLLIHEQLKPKTKYIDLDACLAAADEALKLCARALLDCEEFAFPSLTKAEELNILKGQLPGISPDTRAIMKAICRSLAGEDTGLEVSVSSQDEPQITIDRRVTFKPKSVNGKPLSTLVLDGTPTRDLQVIVQEQGRAYELIEADEGALVGVAFNEAYHWKSSYLNNSRIFHEGRIKEGHDANIEKIADDLQDRLADLPDGAKVAVLASKKLKEMLCDGREDQYQKEHSRRSITDVIKRFDVSYGHFFAHSRASNQFQDCEALILLGSCRLRLDTARARYRALVKRGAKCSFELYYEEVNRAEIDQAIGRGRALRREVLTLVYGPVKPTKSKFDGMVWSTRELRGRDTSQASKLARDYARRHALLGAHISSDRLLTFGLSSRMCRRIITDVAGEEKLTLIKKGNRKILTIHPDYAHEVQARLRPLHEALEQSYYVSKDALKWLGEEWSEWTPSSGPELDRLPYGSPPSYEEEEDEVTSYTLEEVQEWISRRDDLEWEIENAVYEVEYYEGEVSEAEDLNQDQDLLLDLEGYLASAEEVLEGLNEELQEHLDEMLCDEPDKLLRNLEDEEQTSHQDREPLSPTEDFFRAFTLAQNNFTQ